MNPLFSEHLLLGELDIVSTGEAAALGRIVIRIEARAVSLVEGVTPAANDPNA